MKKEKAFSKNGFYIFVLEANIMLHQHVADRGQRFLSTWLTANSGINPVKVIDLACGGSPVSIATMMGSKQQRTFHYTGVDINADQIAAAKEFQFPANVVSIDLVEGNAWELPTLELSGKYDIIFTGMNLHHGSPEEISCLLAQIKTLLPSNGVFINHDFYRPANLPYIKRPQNNPCDPSESFAMISEETLTKFHKKVFDYSSDSPLSEADWRQTFIKRYVKALEEKGAPQAGIQEVVAHVISRDFPMSILQMKEIADDAGFELNNLDLNATGHPLGEYFSLVAATPR